MSLLTTTDEFYNKVKASIAKGQRGNIPYEMASYQPEGLQRERMALIRHCFQLGDVTMQKPRPEFNDLSVIGRDQYDKLSFNAYQANNGQAVAGDPMNSWRSNAMRPIVRDKCISIAAHATARLIFPKVFAYDEDNEIQEDAAQVMETLMEWSTRQKWAETSLKVVIEALTSPACILHSEYSEVYDSKGKLDEVQSGFIDTIVPVDQLYIANFYEPDIQKQDWLIWRRVQSYQLLMQKYSKKYDNFKYVKPGIQYIYNDANQSFYAVYDNNMRQDECEEIIFYHRILGLQAVAVNGVYLPTAGTEQENNPRQDGLYPFSKFGYQFINNRCFYFKSLAFYLMQDASIINTLYPMIVDGTYLKIFPPLINRGGEAIRSNVWIPGASVTLTNPQANVEPLALTQSNDLAQAVNIMEQVEKSITNASDLPLDQGKGSADQTAYSISVQQQQANTILGPFITMIGAYVLQYGKLRIGDIIQNLTVPELLEINGQPELVYKSFLLRDKTGNHKKVEFDYTMPDKMVDSKNGHYTPEDYKNPKHKAYWSKKVFEKQGGLKQLKKDGGKEFKRKLWMANPSLFRKMKYEEAISPDVLNPLSEDLERQFGLAQWDRMVQQVPTGMYDAEETGKLLLELFPRTKKDPDKYMPKQQAQPQQPSAMPIQQPPMNKMQTQNQKPMNPMQQMKQPATNSPQMAQMQ